ncbi:glucose 1-dehydrogenase [Chengkuizengella axinellae]|uniref:Glucose 1-dehydrogenase n=1 Tax=Chengkuizengella axinellae TaxID=3064388 RepID=A0ABT9IZL6_9BACL|nr:glucose 1-dehydrogenase [Chengkuizengella sp. 2205SS18-9]MDP5274577.1 glucose 1-dehydrogenase [Chengkuizengella sp. 2205SS18-9]
MPKIAAITGGAQGIGRALAIAFAKKGYHISIADTNKKAGIEVIRMINQLGGKAMFVPTDISEEKDVVKWVSLTTQDMGAADVLINNAGTAKNAPMLESSLEDFDRVLSVNLRGTFICSQQFAKRMIRKKNGVIINISSTRALMSEKNTEAYSASKGGILALTHAMAVSLGEYGIRVNAISPGWIEIQNWLYSVDAEEPSHTERDRLQHPAGRVGKPEDIAAACLFLAGDETGFITGQNLIIDGGMTIKMIYE